MITGLTASSFENLQLDAGVLIKNFTYSSATDADALKTLVAAAISTENCLGATKGGGTFTATPTTRQVEADGMRNAFKGSTHIDSWEIKLTATLLEFKPNNLKMALGASSLQTSGKMHTITLKQDFEDSDYIDTICWVGDTSEGLMMIEISNALSVGGMNFTFADKQEGTIPLELTAHQASLTSGTVPCKIIIFDPAD